MTLFAHDVQQVYLWTPQQRREVLMYLKLPRWGDFVNSEFGYTDVAETGDPVRFIAPDGSERTFYADGSIANDYSGWEDGYNGHTP